MTELPQRATVDDVLFIPAHGRVFQSKSDGKLVVPFKMSMNEMMDFLEQDRVEAAKLPKDIRGEPIYIVGPIAKGTKCGYHFHRIRKLFEIVIRGAVQWDCQDVYGRRISHEVRENDALYLPPYIHDVYTALEEGTVILAICNTLFGSDDTRTHDTFGSRSFRRLKTKYRHQ